MDKVKNNIITTKTIIILLLFVQQSFAQKKVVEAPTYQPVLEQTEIKRFLCPQMHQIDPIDLEDSLRDRRLAVSRDLLSEGFMIGDVVCIDGAVDGYNGYWLIFEIMNKRWANKIDFLDSQTGSRRENVTIWENVTIEVIGYTTTTPNFEKIYGQMKDIEREH